MRKLGWLEAAVVLVACGTVVFVVAQGATSARSSEAALADLERRTADLASAIPTDDPALAAEMLALRDGLDRLGSRFTALQQAFEKSARRPLRDRNRLDPNRAAPNPGRPSPGAMPQPGSTDRPFALGGGAGGFAKRRAENLASTLELTPDQQQRLEETFTQFAKDFMEIQRKYLKGEIDGDVKNLPQIKELSVKRQQSIREILTEEQYRKFREMMRGSGAQGK